MSSVDHRSTPAGSSLGRGLAGCAAGLILGVVGGIVLIVATALTMAITGSVPQIGPAPAPLPNLQVTLTESFLNRYAAQPPAGDITIDLLPGNRTHVIATTQVEAFGLQVPIQVTGVFEFQLIQQTLRINLVDSRVTGFELDLTSFFQDDVVVINQNLQNTVDEASNYLGVPIVITGVQTTDTEIQFDLREAQ